MAKPFIKWAGGKRSLLPVIEPALPQFKHYYEPFLGGGAVFFALADRLLGGEISDVNPELVTTYKVVRDAPEQLLEALTQHKQYHYAYLQESRLQALTRAEQYNLTEADFDALKKAGKAKREHLLRSKGLTEKDWQRIVPRLSEKDRNKIYYYQVRSQNPQDEIQIAARMIYLNKTCFNGLYRLNSRNKFNVPLGDYAAPEIVDAENIHQCSLALQNIDCISTRDFSKITPEQGDFVYLDPPYDVFNKNSFTRYAGEFNRLDQIRLRQAVDQFNADKVYFMVSNHDTSFIRALYQEFNVYSLSVKRPINSAADKRGGVGEVIVTNYTPDSQLGVKLSAADFKTAEAEVKQQLTKQQKAAFNQYLGIS